MTSSWMSNFAGINHTYLPTEDTNIDDLFKKKEEDTNVIKMIELKELLLDLIQGKGEIDLTEEERKEKEGGSEDKKEMDTIVERIKEFMKEFIQLQDKLNQIYERFQISICIWRHNQDVLYHLTNG